MKSKFFAPFAMAISVVLFSDLNNGANFANAVKIHKEKNLNKPTMTEEEFDDLKFKDERMKAVDAAVDSDGNPIPPNKDFDSPDDTDDDGDA